MDLVADKPDFETSSRGDRVGIWASILCAIHCALTPVLLVVLPSFGKAWSHPSTHWGMALVVIPIAIYMMKKGYLKHGKKWVLAVGTLGITLILIGAVLPYIESNGVDAPPSQSKSSTVILSESETENQCHAASPG